MRGLRTAPFQWNGESLVVREASAIELMDYQRLRDDPAQGTASAIAMYLSRRVSREDGTPRFTFSQALEWANAPPDESAALFDLVAALNQFKPVEKKATSSVPKTSSATG